MSARVSTLAVMALLASATAVPAAAGNPSFDCDGAKRSVEELICTDEELSALDVQVARAVAGALARAKASDVATIKAAHSAWRRKLMRCEANEDTRACTLAAYQDRLSQL